MGIITKHPFNLADKEDFLRVRDALAEEGRLGGSDLGAAVGDNKYKSPYTLWCEKVKLFEPDDISEKEAIKQGVMFEDGVAKRFEMETGRRVAPVPYILTNSDAPHLFASPDRLLVDEDSGLECKTAKEVVMKKFPHGDFPQSYFDQCACYLKVTERKRWYLAIAVYGVSFNIYLLTTVKEEFDRWMHLKDKVEKMENLTQEESEDWKKNFNFLEACYYIDKESLDACEAAAANFIYRVNEGKAGNLDIWPIEEIDGSDSTKDSIKKVNPHAKLDSIVTFDSASEYGIQEDGQIYLGAKSAEVRRLIQQRMEYVEMVEQLEKEQTEVENQIMKLMKEKETYIVPGWKVTYKEIAGRKFAKVAEIEKYFATKNEEVPKGMITESESARGLRFYSQKPKKGKNVKQ